MNSSRAVLTIPPGASVDWVGLYWTGDRGTRAGDAAARCDAAPESATPPTLPPAPDKANQVKLSAGGKPYAAVTANALTAVNGANGGTGFQAYLDITSLVRPAAPSTAAVAIDLVVAELQVASGPGCGGGWAAVLAYSYPNGPDKTYAPDFRSVAVYDGTLPVTAGQRQDIALDGTKASTQDGPKPRLSSALFASGQALDVNALSFGSAPVPRTGAGVTTVTFGTGYQQATAPLPADAVVPGAALGVTPVRNAFVTGVLALTTPLPVKVNLSVTSSVNPASAPVGTKTTLTVTVTNDSDVPASGVKVVVALPAGLRQVTEADGYDNGVWSAGSVTAHGSAALSLSVVVEDTGDLVSTAKITASDLPNQNSPNQTASVTVTAAPTATPVTATPSSESVVSSENVRLPRIAPAILYGIGLFLLGLLLLSLAVVRYSARTR
jgi:uncharacterized repeat protein (TIGR01451 family)